MADSITHDLEAAAELAADLAARGLAAVEALAALIDKQGPAREITLASVAVFELIPAMAALRLDAALLKGHGDRRFREGRAWERARAEEVATAGLRLVSAG